MFWCLLSLKGNHITAISLRVRVTLSPRSIVYVCSDQFLQVDDMSLLYSELSFFFLQLSDLLLGVIV